MALQYALPTEHPAIESRWAMQLLLALPEALLTVGPDGEVRFLNPQAERLLNVSADQAVGRHWSELMILRDTAGTKQPLTALPEGQGESDCQGDDPHYLLTRCDGSRRVVKIASASNPAWRAWPDRVVLLRDCTRAYDRLRQLKRQCARDHLTNLVNRREFERRLGTVLERARQDGSQHVLLFMDLDRFKQINDTHGHLAGDAVLKQVATTLRSSIRERDTLGRLGGDEFGLLMEHCLPAEGVRTVSELRLLLQEQEFNWQGQSLSLGISIGLVNIDRNSGTFETVWAQADAACYKAKRAAEGAAHPLPGRVVESMRRNTNRD